MKPLEEPSLVQGDFWRLGLEGRQLPLETPPTTVGGHASGYKQLAAGHIKGPASVSREVMELRLHRIPHLHSLSRSLYLILWGFIIIITVTKMISFVWVFACVCVCTP